MSLAGINEQLLRTIGTGVALFGADGRSLRFHNASFAEWFGTPPERATLDTLLTGLDIQAMEQDLEAGGSHSAELEVRPRRRALVIAITVSRTVLSNGPVLVLECQNITRIRELESMIESYSAMVERNTRQIEREKERVEKLLLNIMPRQVYEEFKSFGVVTPQLYRDVSVLMLDFVGFTQLVETMDPTVTVGELNDIFTAFDRIAEQFGAERIKTMGDAYIAVAGLPDPSPDHARAVAACAIRFIRYLERRNQSHPHRWQCRVGIATGAVVGSVVGIQKYVYDVFGPAMNLAARLQSMAEPNTVLAHEKMKAALIDEFRLTDLGVREVRSFGDLRLMAVSGGEAPRRVEASVY